MILFRELEANIFLQYLNTPDVGIRFDIDKVRVVGSGFHVLYDVILLVLPLNIIFKTKLKRRDRGTWWHEQRKSERK